MKRALQLRKQGLTSEAIRAKIQDESQVQWLVWGGMILAPAGVVAKRNSAAGPSGFKGNGGLPNYVRRAIN